MMALSASIPENLRTLAIEVFNSDSLATSWFNTQHLLLGCTPAEYLKDHKQSDEIAKILNAIKYGHAV